MSSRNSRKQAAMQESHCHRKFSRWKL